MDLYQVLGVGKNASEQEIKSAYRRLALQYHPDKNPSPDAKQKFQELTHAYSILIDPEKKYNYDHGITEDEVIDFDEFMAFLDPDFFRDLGFPVMLT